MRMLRFVLLVAVVACGTPAVRPPAEGRGGSAPAALDEPEAVLRALAAAARTDDGAGLDALVHPVHGLWLWWQPGAYVVPTVLVRAGGDVPPSQRIANGDMNDYWRQEYWPHVAGGLDGLTRLDRDPSDRRQAIYGDCGDEAPAAPLRAWLATAEDLGPYYGEILVEANVTLAPAMSTGLVHYRVWGLDVWLARDQGRLWVAHIQVWTPCDA